MPSLLIDPDALPCPWMSVGADGLVRQINAALCELLHGTPQQLQGLHIDALLGGGGRLLYYGYFMPMLRMHGAARELALSLRGCDGATVEVLAHARAHPAPPQAAEHIDLVVLPVVERRRLEDELLRVKRAAELAPGMLFQFVCEAGGHCAFAYASEAARRLYGVVPAQLRESDAPWLERIHHEDRERVRRALHAAADNGQTWRDRFRVTAPDGGQRWHAVQATASAGDGRVVWHGYVADITEQYELEVAAQSRETAERASRAKTEFLARASHELRTPLNAILGFAQLLELESGALGGPQRRQLSLIGESGRELLRLVDDMLEIARIEADRATLNPVTLPLRALLARALELAREQAQGQGIVLQLVECAPALLVLADEARLLQVLGHLLSNAVQYNHPGGHVWLSAREDGRGHLSIEVKDDGVGLDAQQQAALFQPFNRLGAERGGVKGAGLGLTIVQRLLPLMDGAIAVRSLPGMGSTFTVRMPAVAAEAARAATPGLLEHELPQPQGAPPHGTDAPGGAAGAAGVCDAAAGGAPHAPKPAAAGDAPPKPAPAPQAGTPAVDVLYIEDNPVNALLMQTLFQMRPQWRLQVAVDGAGGVAEALRCRPRLLLVDMHLPDMNGIQVLAELRRHVALRDVPAIVVSAAAMSSDIEQAQAAGFAAYWTKPLDLPHMLGELDSLLG
ncbi:hybrid sensor histidine kinase/response regulator [Azohydromonas lata]|uniref:hybrid sensor histidine kinase/response regulator n=1 Tax=Azohydromonas lata TaxID=45677 RepID=UPI000832C239|nr:hybrid sensor histidine kinase/response regulator [Azohydromonas lata]